MFDIYILKNYCTDFDKFWRTLYIDHDLLIERVLLNTTVYNHFNKYRFTKHNRLLFPINRFDTLLSKRQLCLINFVMTMRNTIQSVGKLLIVVIYNIDRSKC